MLAELKQELANIQRELPYNELPRYLVRAGVETPRAFGGDCTKQTEELVENLRRKTSGRIAYLPVINGPHQAAVAEDSGETYLLDPYLLHHEPIHVSEILKEKSTVQFAIYPKHPSVAQPKLLVRSSGESRITIETYGDPFSPENPTEYYSFDLKKVNEESTPVAVKYLKSKKSRAELAIRTLNQDNGVSNLFFDIGKRAFGLRKTGGAKPRTYSEAYQQDLFLGELEKMADQLQVGPQELRGYFHKAVLIQATLE